jgi:hypothetical protein
MKDELDSRTPQFGLRDFLFYLVPGGITLAAACVAGGVRLTDVKEWGSVGESIVGLLFAYFLGQVMYPVTYPLRTWLAPKAVWVTPPAEFAKLHLQALEQHSGYYVGVIFRDRSFARFALAMVFPTLLFGLSLANRMLPTSKSGARFLLAVTIAAAYGFIVRYRKYETRYHLEVLMCMGREFEAPKSTQALD